MGEALTEKDVVWVTSPARGLSGGSGFISCFTMKMRARLLERLCPRL